MKQTTENKLNRLRIPTGRRQTSWLSTGTAKELNQGDYLKQIQLVVRVGLELGISRFQIRHPNHSATFPPCKRFSSRLILCFISMLEQTLSCDNDDDSDENDGAISSVLQRYETRKSSFRWQWSRSHLWSWFSCSNKKWRNNKRKSGDNRLHVYVYFAYGI